jgi:hypothetical protein
MRRVIAIRCGHNLKFLCGDAAPFLTFGTGAAINMPTARRRAGRA